MGRQITVFLLIICIFLTGCSDSKSSYPAQLIWNDTIYSLTADQVQPTELDIEIGEVKKRVHPMPKNNGESNELKRGNKFFKIKDIEVNQHIAVEKIDGKYYKATNLRRYFNHVLGGRPLDRPSGSVMKEKYMWIGL